MVLILFGNIVFVIHKINYLGKNHLQKIHYRMKSTKFIPSIIFSCIDRVKAEFIRAKYQQMAYINRLKDETNSTLEDLNLVNKRKRYIGRK